MNDKDKFKIIKKVNNLEEYKKALSEGLDINFIDNYGKNALFFAARNGISVAKSVQLDQEPDDADKMFL